MTAGRQGHRPTRDHHPRNEEAMTDRPNHRAAAERLLADADEWEAR